MIEAIIHPLPIITSTLQYVSVPIPGPDEVLVKVVAAGSNPKDWTHPTALNLHINSGDDIAGTVHALGSSVEACGRFTKGDRVAAFHRIGTPGGAYGKIPQPTCQSGQSHVSGSNLLAPETLRLSVDTTFRLS